MTSLTPAKRLQTEMNSSTNSPTISIDSSTNSVSIPVSGSVSVSVFNSFPDDLLLEFISLLSIQDSIALCHTSKSLSILLNHDSLWEIFVKSKWIPKFNELDHIKQLIHNNSNNNNMNNNNNNTLLMPYKSLYNSYHIEYPNYYHINNIYYSMRNIINKLLSIIKLQFPMIYNTLIIPPNSNILIQYNNNNNNNNNNMNNNNEEEDENILNPIVNEKYIESLLSQLPYEYNRTHLLMWNILIREINGQLPELNYHHHHDNEEENNFNNNNNNNNNNNTNKWTGLFGGFSFYAFQTNLRLLSIEDSIKYSIQIYERLNIPLIPFTDSILHSDGFISYYINPLTGEILRRRGGIDRGIPQFHIANTNLLSFLNQFTERLDTGIYGESDQSYISRFAVCDPCGSITITRGIRIQASVLYVPEMNERGKYFFTYQIKITYENDYEYPNLSARLVTRSWNITDSNGRVEHIQGPGVIGLYPHIYPSCPVFKYESCCPLRTPTGTMGGSFQFQLLDDSNEIFDADINPFIFDINKNFI